MQLFHQFLGKCLAEAWMGKALETTSPGQLTSDTNLCTLFEAANMMLCVNHSILKILGININKSKSNLL